MSPQLTKIKNTAGVQAMFIFGLGQDPAIATKNCKQLSVDLSLCHAQREPSDEFIKLADLAANGVRPPAAALLVASKLPDNERRLDTRSLMRRLFCIHHATTA